MSIEKEEILSIHEHNWVIHLYCSVPYHEARKIEDEGEREFLIQTAALMKLKHERAQLEHEAKEDRMQKSIEATMADAAKKGMTTP